MLLPWHEVQNLDLLAGTRLNAGESCCPTGYLFAAVFEQRPNIDEPTTARLLGEQFADVRSTRRPSSGLRPRLGGLVDAAPLALCEWNSAHT